VLVVLLTSRDVVGYKLTLHSDQSMTANTIQSFITHLINQQLSLKALTALTKLQVLTLINTHAQTYTMEDLQLNSVRNYAQLYKHISTQRNTGMHIRHYVTTDSLTRT